MSEGQGGSRFRRGEGVDQRETDEGTTFSIDVGLGEAVCLPRIAKMPHSLCKDDLSENSAPHPTRHTPSHLPPKGKAYKNQNTQCFPKLFILQFSFFSFQFPLPPSEEKASPHFYTLTTNH